MCFNIQNDSLAKYDIINIRRRENIKKKIEFSIFSETGRTTQLRTEGFRINVDSEKTLSRP